MSTENTHTRISSEPFFEITVTMLSIFCLENIFQITKSKGEIFENSNFLQNIPVIRTGSKGTNLMTSTALHWILILTILGDCSRG